jgi:hypothetical protein
MARDKRIPPPGPKFQKEAVVRYFGGLRQALWWAKGRAHRPEISGYLKT